MENEFCIRCGLEEDHQNHNHLTCDNDGWHSYTSQKYLNDLEDALWYARKHYRKHEWVGMFGNNSEYMFILDLGTSGSYEHKNCKVCGANNWGNKNGVCFGNNSAEIAIISAHNRGDVYKKEEKRKTEESMRTKAKINNLLLGVLNAIIQSFTKIYKSME